MFRTTQLGDDAERTHREAAAASSVVLQAERTYDRIADEAWSMAMAILGDSEAAGQVVVAAFRAHPCVDGRCRDLTILTSVVRGARAAGSAREPACG